LNGVFNVFVSKINADASKLLYSTYLGGSGLDFAYGISVDSLGNAYVTGFTDSDDFPVKNPIQPANAGGFDSFICKISLSQLDNIETEVNDIEVKLDNPDFGLESIKEGINSIEAKLYPDTLTTGPVVRDKHADSLIIVLLNNTAVAKAVTFYVYNIKKSPSTVVLEKTVNIEPGSSRIFICSSPPLIYEIRFTGIVQGIYALTATRKQDFSDSLRKSTLISANTFSHSQLAAFVNP